MLEDADDQAGLTEAQLWQDRAQRIRKICESLKRIEVALDGEDSRTGLIRGLLDRLGGNVARLPTAAPQRDACLNAMLADERRLLALAGVKPAIIDKLLDKLSKDTVEQPELEIGEELLSRLRNAIAGLREQVCRLENQIIEGNMRQKSVFQHVASGAYGATKVTVDFLKFADPTFITWFTAPYSIYSGSKAMLEAVNEIVGQRT